MDDWAGLPNRIMGAIEPAAPERAQMSDDPFGVLLHVYET